MKILSGIPVLACQHIDKTLAFYTGELRFVTVNRRESASGLQWAHLMHGETSIMLERAEPLPENAGLSSPVSLYFFVDDVDALHHYLVSRGLQASSAETTAFQLREFSITDPENNILRLGQLLNS